MQGTQVTWDGREGFMVEGGVDGIVSREDAEPAGGSNSVTVGGTIKCADGVRPALWGVCTEEGGKGLSDFRSGKKDCTSELVRGGKVADGAKGSTEPCTTGVGVLVWTEPVQAGQSWVVLEEGGRSVVSGCVSVVMESRGDGADNVVDGLGGDGAVREEGGKGAGGN